MIGTLFHEVLYRPLFNGLVFLYDTIAFQDLGLAIICLTIAVRILLFPLFYKGLKSQAMLLKIQPHIQKIQKDHKENKERQAQALIALYKEHKVNPFTGIGIMLLQLPILIALYRVFLNGFADSALESTYSFISAPTHLNPIAFGLIDLQKRDIIILLFAAAAQFLQGYLAHPKKAKGAPKDDNLMANMGQMMIFIGPIITVWILSFMPSAVGIYWATTALFSSAQQLIINKRIYGINGRDTHTTTKSMDARESQNLHKGTA